MEFRFFIDEAKGYFDIGLLDTSNENSIRFLIVKSIIKSYEGIILIFEDINRNFKSFEMLSNHHKELLYKNGIIIEDNCNDNRIIFNSDISTDSFCVVSNDTLYLRAKNDPFVRYWYINKTLPTELPNISTKTFMIKFEDEKIQNKLCFKLNNYNTLLYSIFFYLKINTYICHIINN